MISFNDYRLLRELGDRLPGSLEISLGDVNFNDEYTNEAWWPFGKKDQGQQQADPNARPSWFNWRPGQPRPSQMQPPPLPPGHTKADYQHGPGGSQQNVISPMNQRPSIDTLNNPTFKADVAAIRGVFQNLKTPQLKQRMQQWMGQIFKKIPGVSQQAIGAGGQGPESTSTVATDQMPSNWATSASTSTEPGPQGYDDIMGGNATPEADAARNAALGSFSADTFGSPEPTSAPNTIPMPQQRRKAAMWKS